VARIIAMSMTLRSLMFMRLLENADLSG
jgi:hypothetical protein